MPRKYNSTNKYKLSVNADKTYYAFVLVTLINFPFNVQSLRAIGALSMGPKADAKRS